MDNDFDMNLYNQYLIGNKDSFDILYKKYKDKIHYFIFNIIKDWQIAEDITQEVFIYVLNNKVRQGYSLKNYIYLIARSRALSYINSEKRREDIAKKYLLDDEEKIQEDVLDNIIKQENKKELIEAINQLDDKYKNAIYLVKIEGLSYSQTAEILGQAISDIKNIIHRGKSKLYKILLKKGFEKINKVSKIIITIVVTCIILSGIIVAAINIYNTSKGKASITPTYTSVISTIDKNKVWCGTFNLIWNDFMNEYIGGKVEFEDGNSELANELNKQSFKVEQLSSDSYFKIHGIKNKELKNKIEEGIKEKFNETSSILDKCNWEDGNRGYILYAMLKKEFNYLKPFSTLKEDTFGNFKDKVKYFGIESGIGKSASENVEVLFYNSKSDFAIKLKTKENEEVFLYRTTGENKTFEENYNEMLKKQKGYTGKVTFEDNDILKIPFIKINDEINYDELCGKYIKGTNIYIEKALQTIEFELNNYGGTVKSEAFIEVLKGTLIERGRDFIFNDTFFLYLKEENKQNPYFALRVDNTDVLVNVEE